MFAWREDARAEPHVGVFAQEVHAAFPDAAHEGNDVDVWGVDYGRLVPLLLGAVQELTARVVELESRLSHRV